MQAEKKAILFVCLGNICRSPIALCVFKHLLKAQNKEEQWLVDSAGTGNWHVGHPMDPRAAEVLTKHNVSCVHKARQIRDSDFLKFDYMVVMSHANFGDIKVIKTRTDRRKLFKGAEGSQKIMYLGDYDPQGVQEVEDPYYLTSDPDAFEKCYQHIYRSCENLLKKLENNEIIEANTKFG